MFTHDIQKKTKKWHDGTLRFHTFNKRVMVYDESKNFVGDLHYRQSEEFGEGLELKLDRPVLVLVEDPLGQSNTDLTPLLSRQKQDGSPRLDRTQASQPSRASLSRINAANSQIKPKSIKELLAGSQGASGRARLVTQSPYEQRHPLSEIQPSFERPAKRQKIQADPTHPSTARVVGAPLPAVVEPIAKAPILQHTPPAATVYGISSDDEPDEPDRRTKKTPRQAMSGRGTSRLLTKSDTAKKKGTKKSQRNEDAENSSRATFRRMSPVPNLHDRPRPTSAASVGSRPSTSDSRHSQNSLNNGPRSSLRFATQRVRPKLMYKTLLSSDVTGTQQHSRGSVIDGQSHREVVRNKSLRHVTPPRLHRAADLLETDSYLDVSQTRNSPENVISTQEREQPQHEDEGDPLRGSVQSDAPSPVRHSPDDNFDDIQITVSPIHTSPLFIPRTASQTSPPPSQGFVIGDFELEPEPEPEPQRNTTNAGDIAVPAITQQDLDGHPEEPTLPSSPVFPVPQPRPHRSPVQEAPLPAMLLSEDRPQQDNNPNVATPAVSRLQSHHGSSTRKRPFRRVVSENLGTSRGTRDDVLSPTELDLDLSDFNVSDTSPVKHPGRAPSKTPQLGRSTSDPVTLNKATLRPESPASSAEEHDEVQKQISDPITIDINSGKAVFEQQRAITPGATDTGPWSTDEAFILFDWWPPGRQKPDYGELEDAELGDARTTMHDRYEREDADADAAQEGASKKYGMFGSAKFVSQR